MLLIERFARSLFRGLKSLFIKEETRPIIGSDLQNTYFSKRGQQRHR